MYSKNYKSSSYKVDFFDVRTFPFIPIAIFAVVLYFMWGELIEAIKPDTYKNDIDKPITSINQRKKVAGVITEDGHFKNGNGVKTKFTVSQARADAEALASYLKTSKNTSWFGSFKMDWMGNVNQNVKKRLNHNAPSSYRAYVIEVYRDVFTDKHSLQDDVRDALSSILNLTTLWDNNVTKYFIL